MEIQKSPFLIIILYKKTKKAWKFINNVAFSDATFISANS